MHKNKNLLLLGSNHHAAWFALYLVLADFLPTRSSHEEVTFWTRRSKSPCIIAQSQLRADLEPAFLARPWCLMPADGDESDSRGNGASKSVVNSCTCIMLYQSQAHAAWKSKQEEFRGTRKETKSEYEHPNKRLHIQHPPSTLPKPQKPHEDLKACNSTGRSGFEGVG